MLQNEATIRPSSGRSRASSASMRSGASRASRSSTRRPGEIVKSASVPHLSLRRGISATEEAQHAPWGHTLAPNRLGGASHELIGHAPLTNVPGYTGFIPGKESENVLGASHCRANALALMAVSRRGELHQEHDFARRSNAYGILAKRRGADVPGYTGFIPGKHAGGVFGSSYKTSNEVAQQVRREQAVSRVHRAPQRMSSGPLSWTGNHALYVADG
mmetsp:Transcript_14351/g.23459  ORF Transcript_14351/g.23459 Transcript_14351/m.23459 type:complete len:217 (-) Transcript_14351:94-744(-)